MMMKAPPASPFKVTETNLLLEFLIVTLDTPAQLRGVDKVAERNILWKRGEPIFGGLILAFRPLDQQPFLRRFLEFVVRANMNTYAGKSRGLRFVCPFSPLDRLPGFRGQLQSKRLGGNRSCRVVAPLLGGPTAQHAWLRDQRLRLDTGYVELSQLTDPGAQFGIVAIASVEEYHIARKAHLTGPADLLERNLRLGLEADLLGHAHLAPTLVIFSPGVRQIQPIGHRQACGIVSKRQRHSDLTICLFAELPAVLMRDSNRVLSFLRKAGVVDDPGFDRAMALDLGQHHLAHLRQDRVVRPCPLPNKMQQRLMLRRALAMSPKR